MMRLSEDKITKFIDDEGFTVYIEERNDGFDARIGHKDYAIIELIYGVPRVQPYTGEVETFDKLVEDIMEDIIEHKYWYTKRNIMEDEDDDI